MGRRIQLHMTAVDRYEFCRYAQYHLGLQFGWRDGEAQSVDRLSCEDVGEAGTAVVWSEGLCQNLRRKWIPNPGYYRVDTLRLPVMEYVPSSTAKWEDQPALCQGRLFGDFEANLGKPKQFLRSYQVLHTWVKKNYRKAPNELEGYVGPSAWEFYSQGGYLLPFFVPPRIPEWLSSIASQHSR